MKNVISGICIALVLFHTVSAGIIIVPEFIQRAVHLTLVLVLAFLFKPMWKREDGRLSFWSWIPIVISVLTGLYVVVFNNDIMFSQGMLSMEMIVIGWVLIFLVLELTRRAAGWILALIATIAVLYPIFGKYLPGLIGHRGYNLGRIASTLGLSLEGIFGAPLGASAEFVVLFIFLASVLNECGMGQYLLKLALSMTGRMTGGPAKTAVIASALFGTISGSAVANVVGTGTFTIPMMKKQGFPAHIAGAVEAVASTGGQIMPPIMGAAAFIMAQILNISYVDVMKAAIIPALLYYTSVFMSIHFHALRLKIKPLEASEVPSLRETLKEGWHYLVPLIVLIVLMVGVRYTVTLSVLWAIVVTFVVTWFNRQSRVTWSKFVNACVDTGKNVLTVAAACAAAGLVIGSINLTGIGFKMFSLIMGLTARNHVARPHLHHAGLHGDGHGCPHHGGLHRRGRDLRSCPHRFQAHPHSRPYVRFLLRHSLGHHTSRGSRGVCRCGPRRGKSDENRLVGRRSGRQHLYRPLHLRLQPRTAGGGRAAERPLGLRHGCPWSDGHFRLFHWISKDAS